MLVAVGTTQSRYGWGVPDLQVSVDHLRALNATLVELQNRQQDLEQAVWVHREQLRDLLQEPGCQGCAETLSRARDLELGADFSQVQAGYRPLERGGCSACWSRGPPPPRSHPGLKIDIMAEGQPLFWGTYCTLTSRVSAPSVLTATRAGGLFWCLFCTGGP